MSGRIVIVAYRPKPGRQQALDELVRTHVDVLRREGLASDRPATRMRADDGTVIEVFEWASPSAIEQAHENATVTAMWRQFAEACDYVPIGEVAEAANPFSEFEPF